MTEKDPNGLKPTDPGSKLDHGKLQAGILEEVFPHALEAVAQVADFGARKYSRGGCLHVPDGRRRYLDAEWRHRLARAKGESHADDSGLLHEAHEAWNKLMQLELLLREQQAGAVDDWRDGAGLSQSDLDALLMPDDPQEVLERLSFAPLDDGHGNQFPALCECGAENEIVRPGKFRCSAGCPQNGKEPTDNRPPRYETEPDGRAGRQA